MAKNANEIAVKSRQTKLSKKNSEELIDIILRKDKTERINAETIKALKAENNSLKERLNNMEKDVEGMTKSIIGYKNELALKKIALDNIKKDSDLTYDKYVEETNKSVSLETKVDSFRRLAFALCAIIVVETLLFMLF